MYTDQFITTEGCDSARVLNLTVSVILSSQLAVEICQGESYEDYYQSGIYTDTLVAAFGCDSIRTVSLDVIPSTQSFIDASICDGLSFGHTVAGTYTDTLISNRGCDSIRIVKLSAGLQYIPNVFSPNGDEINDVFEVISFPEDAMAFSYFAIYDRFGDMVYQTDSWPVRWNGMSTSGKYYNPGVYAFILISNCNGTTITDYGNITLLR